jgi:hypothetical protein
MSVILLASAALVAALAVATATAARAGSAKKVGFTCTVHLQTLAPPGSSGEDFGTAACTPVATHRGAAKISGGTAAYKYVGGSST